MVAPNGRTPGQSRRSEWISHSLAHSLTCAYADMARFAYNSNR